MLSVIIGIAIFIGIIDILVILGRKPEKEPLIYVDNNNRCIYCGEVIPEGTQVCVVSEEVSMTDKYLELLIVAFAVSIICIFFIIKDWRK